MTSGASASHQESREQQLARHLLVVVDELGVVQSVSGGWNGLNIIAGDNGFDFFDTLSGFASRHEESSHLLREVLKHRMPAARLEYQMEGVGWVEVSILPFNHRDARGALVVCTDISVRKKAELELRGSEEQLQAIIRHEPECIKVIDCDGKLREMNPAGLKIVGADSLAEVAGRQVIDLVHPDDRAAFTQLHQISCAGGTGELTFRIIGMKGRQAWVETHAVPLRDSSGQVTAVLSVTRDITERREVEERLRRSEATMAAAQHISRFGSWQLELLDQQDINCNKLWWSDEVFRIFGYEPGGIEPTNEAFFQTVHPDDRVMILRAVEEAIRTRGGYSIDHRIILPDGQVRHIHENAKLFLEEKGGQPMRLVGTVHDITERKLAEEALKTSEERFRQAFANASVGFAITDVDGIIQHINNHYCQITGYTEAEMIGKSFASITHPDDVAGKLELSRRLVQGEITDFNVEKRYLRKNGEIAWVENSVSAVRADSGEPLHLLVLCKDITAARRDQEQLRLLETSVEHLNDIVLITEAAPLDEPGPRIVFVNAAFTTHNGYSRDEAIGRSPRFLQGPDSDRETLKRIRAALAAARPVKEEIINYKKDGTPFLLELDIRPITSADGRLTHFVAVQRDITERKAAEDRLRLSNLRYERQHAVLTTLMRSGLLQASDLDEAFHSITAEIGRATGMARVSIWLLGSGCESIVCRSLYETTPARHSSGLELHAAHFPAYFRALKENEVIATADACEDSRTREFNESYLKPLGIASMLDAPLNVGGVLVGVLCQEHVGPPHSWTRDEQSFAVSLANFISLVLAQWERRRIEDVLRQQASLLDKANDAILVRSLDHTITYWNKSAEKLYGWTAAEAMGRKASELLYRDEAQFHAMTSKVITEGEWAGEIQQTRKNGDQILIEARWTLVRDAAEQPKCILAINTDITEKKRLEEQVIRSQRMESIGTLAGGIAHDLNNVLTPIMMSVDLLRLRISDTACHDTLGTIASSVQRGAEMLGQVLSFAKGMDGQRLPVRLGRLLQDLGRIIRDTFPKNIHLHFAEPPAAWTVSGDATQLHQVLLNLCVNARDSMPAGGTLTLDVEQVVIDAQYAAMNIEAREGAHYMITVTDDGTGIPPEALPKIFEPFFTTKEPGKGTGLGLSTSQAIVKSHGGFMRAMSEPGNGSVFHVYLPACSGESSEPQIVPEPPPLPHGQEELVLLVDDEAAVREITRQTLEAHGYRVLLAADGAEAVKLYSQRQQEIAVVLTDMVMPVMDGSTTIQVILKMNPRARIIAASGLVSKAGKAKAASAGVGQFLPKPYTAETILRALHQALHTD